MYYFIVNPHAGCGRGLKTWQKIEKILTRKGVEYNAFLTDSAEQAQGFAAELTGGTADEKTIVVVGGDGTFSDVLNGLDLDSSVTLGYVPVGVGNDLARSLRLPSSPARCLKRIFRAKNIRYMDYGVMTFGEESSRHRRFIVSAGMGLDADMSWRADNFALKPMMGRLGLNRAAGVTAKVGAYLRAKPCPGNIILDGVKRVEFNNIYFVSAQLQPYECSGLRLAPYAVDSDGRIEVCVLSHSSRREVGNLLLCARCGRKYLKGLRIYQCSDLKIHTEEPVLFHADGESSGEKLRDLEVGCIERKVKMIL
ncbi:MAG: diacylglycerol kinase family lipid kinase [Clostridium sp.]|nr:diacylglycerol kinase family lipid kinase [Clostridium sp.]